VTGALGGVDEELRVLSERVISSPLPTSSLLPMGKGDPKPSSWRSTSAIHRKSRERKQVHRRGAGSRMHSALESLGDALDDLDLGERVAKTPTDPTADPSTVAAASKAIDGQQDDARKALLDVERHLEQFVRKADDPLDPMQAVAREAAEVADIAKRGAPVTGKDLGRVGARMFDMARTFAGVYGPFAQAREAAYAAAEAFGISTRRSSKKATVSDIASETPADLATEVGVIAKDFTDRFRDVQEKSAKALNAARRAIEMVDEPSVHTAVDAFLDFRDSVGPGYFAMLNGVARRVDELTTRMGRSRVREVPTATSTSAASEEPKIIRKRPSLSGL
jgi:hypothetical protein